MSALYPRQHFLLDQACRPIREVFGSYGPYLVGSAMGSGPFGDVDVRLILEDARYDEIHAVMTADGMAFLGLALGEYLASRTGLPIDFQVQRATEANATHSRENGGTSRNPVGMKSAMRRWEGDAPKGRIPLPDDDGSAAVHVVNSGQVGWDVDAP